MSPSVSAQPLETNEQLPVYSRILLATDSSDHANRGALEATALAKSSAGSVTAAHVYAAKMHDIRFRQMEGGLPEQYREEQELERQRDVHDDLITRGLSVITDSYLDQVDRTCKASDVHFKRRSLEGKNYRELVREANSGEYDLLIMGSLGLGATVGSRIGGVCNRVARRTAIDMLVIKQPDTSIVQGPIVVAIDGSEQSYGALLTALSLSKSWDVSVTVVAAFDPYYHYVAFNRIADVLSEEAGKVFRFKEQEKLHEEIIDSGLAKIYQSHLDVAVSIATDYGVEIETRLLDGKPHDAITQYLKERKPSLLLIGQTGIHADEELDIGGNTENLLYNVDCAVLMTQREYRPRVDVLADVTTSWTIEAEERMQNVPDFVRPMARMAILRYAQESGHTVITERIVEEATVQLMPRHAEQMMQEIVDADAERTSTVDQHSESLDLPWEPDARKLLDAAALAVSVRNNIEFRAIKKARSDGASLVKLQHLQPFLAQQDQQLRSEQVSLPSLHWQAAALARLMKVPEGFMREMSKKRIEDYAGACAAAEITLELAEQGLASARLNMQVNLQERSDASQPSGTSAGRCPFANLAASTGAVAPRPASLVERQTDCTPVGEEGRLSAQDSLALVGEVGAGSDKNSIEWEHHARQRLDSVPVGFCRSMTIRATEMIASQQGLSIINLQTVESVLGVFGSGSAQVIESLDWTDAARTRIERAPDMVRGMLIREIESAVSRDNKTTVEEVAVEGVLAQWQDGGAFHLDPGDSRQPL